MKNKIIESRIDEIQRLVSSNDLATSVKRLMDLVSDFSISINRKHEVILISRAYNEYHEEFRLYGRTERNISQATKISSQILEFTQTIFNEINSDQTLVGTTEKEISIHTSKNNSINRKTESTELEFEREKFNECQSLKNPSKEVVFDGIQITKRQTSATKFVLHPINLQLKTGEITAIVGENGSGKTTLLELITGTSKKSGGTLTYPSLTNNEKIDLYFIKQKIAYIPQVLPKIRGSISDNLHFIASTCGIKGEENEISVNFIINRLGLEKYKNANWEQLSSGFQMRFSLAKTLVWHPQLIALDEPLANLDINTQLLFLRDLRNLADSIKHPMSIIVSSQHLHEIESIADNIIFFKDGKALYNGKMKDFGNDREENSFEMACDLPLIELKNLIDELDYKSIETNGNHFIINTTRDVQLTDLLDNFITHKIPIKFVRDISRSTRKLFKEEI